MPAFEFPLLNEYEPPLVGRVVAAMREVAGEPPLPDKDCAALTPGV